MLAAAVLERLAAQEGCSRINTDESSEFARVWVGCAVFGAALSLLALGTSWWGADPADGEWDFDAKAATADGGACRPDLPATKRAWQGGGRTRPCGVSWYGDPTPDLARAIRHLRASSPTDERGGWRSIWRTRMSQLNEVGGTGTELYFILLRDLGVCFALMAAITSPITAFSLFGDFAPSSAPLWTRTTIANLGRILHGELDQADRLEVLGCQGMPLSTLTTYFGWLDLVAALLLQLCLVRFRFLRAHQAARTDDAEQVTCADFAVEIDRLPARLREHANYERLLREHLYCLLGTDPISDEASGLQPRVHELTLVRDFGGRLSALKRQAQLQAALAVQRERHAAKAVAKLEARLASRALRLREVAAEESLPVIRAFAILNTTADVKELLQPRWHAQPRRCFCCRRGRSAPLFQGVAVRLRKAPEPSDILWEHQDVQKLERWARRTAVFVAYAIATAVSLALVYLLSSFASSQTHAAQGLQGNAQCDGMVVGSGNACDIAKARSWTVASLANRTAGDVQCFCMARSQAEVFRSAELQEVCGEWLVDVGRSLVVTMACSLLIVFINIGFRMLLILFADFERPRSSSNLNSSLMRKLSVAQTLNTSFVVFLVNYNGLGIFTGKYTDFGRGWYAVVGATLLSNMMLQAVVPPLMNLMVFLFIQARRRWFSSRVDHQATLLELFTNPPFHISDRFAKIVTTVFCTMTYSSGLPALNLFAAAYMFGTYWVDKLVLLRGSERPPAFNNRMPLEASNIMLYAIPLHCVFAIGMYGQPCLFPSSPLSSAWAGRRWHLPSSVFGQFSDFLARAWLESTWMFSALLALLVALWACWWAGWLFDTTLGKVFRAARRALRLQRSERILPAPGELDVADGLDWEAARQVIETTCPPASYKLERSHEFAPLMRFLRRGGQAGVDRSQPEAPGVASVRAVGSLPERPAAALSRRRAGWKSQRRRAPVTDDAP